MDEDYRTASQHRIFHHIAIEKPQNLPRARPPKQSQGDSFDLDTQSPVLIIGLPQCERGPGNTLEATTAPQDKSAQFPFVFATLRT
ncbi:uncharacterized protein PAC_09471 [Phialocephala subalpina]|uniref:Uncharacterized protein n=1 Tax=Phialocephala subalpina TaxID=576137 RepID=A0A1L7X3K4_9HELO|nr:uncharacterized protein PAC_09471 [Phialocephala subalpina]